MTGEVSFPLLRVALERWMSEAIGYLKEKEDARLAYAEPPSWYRSEDGLFRQKSRVVHVWNPAYDPSLQKLSSWATVDGILHEDERLSRQIDNVVGSVQRGSHLDVMAAAHYVIPKPDELDRVDDVFRERYVELDDFLAADMLEYIAIWPLPGIGVCGGPFHLGGELELDDMTDVELGIALDTGIVRPPGWNFPVVDPKRSIRACARHRYRLPKIVGEPEPNLKRELLLEFENRMQALKASIEESLSLVLPESAMTAGRFSFGRSPGVLGTFVSYQHATVPDSRRWRSTQLDRTSVDVLMDVWRAVREPELLNHHKGLALALRRLSYQAHRERPEDELLDVMIAAEALYLSDLGNEPYRGELRFRLSLRAATWADLDEIEYGRRDVFKILQSAYDARSSIAHGGTPKASALKVCDQRVAIGELVQAVRSIVAAGCRAALPAAVSRRWPPDWNELVFLSQDLLDERQA